MRVIFIIFFVLLLLTIIVIFVHSRSSNKLSQYCSSNSDCASGYLCKPNPYSDGKKQCVKANQSYCPITPVTQLVKCRLDATGYCSDTCLNTPKFSCVQVDEEHPYVWKQGNQNVNIPSSPTNYGWCLPDIVNRDIQCNQYTSDYVLEQVGDNKYQWGCYCKYPNLFDHGNGPGSDCTLVRACGHMDNIPLGNLYVPKPYSHSSDFKLCTSDSMCDPGDRCLGAESPAPCGYLGATGGYIDPPKDCSDPAKNCVCHTDWLNIPNKIDPLTGQCVCNSDDFASQCIVRASDYIMLNCAPRQKCGDYDIDPNNGNCSTRCYQDPNTSKCVCCKCPQGYIRCPDDILNQSTQLWCQMNGPTCIPDPCNSSPPGVAPNGYWNGKNCICASGYVSIEDENNSVGAVCLNVCNSATNPCGNRGQCIIQNGQAQCTNCVAPYTNELDSTCTCSQEDPGAGLGNGAECCNDKDCASKDCGGYPDCDSGSFSSKGTCQGTLPVIWPKTPGQTCIPSKPGPVICSGTTASCPQGNVCCQNTSGSWNCCPFPDGVCCNDNIHCCPGDHPICNTQAGYCTKQNGSDPIPMQGYSAPK